MATEQSTQSSSSPNTLVGPLLSTTPVCVVFDVEITLKLRTQLGKLLNLHTSQREFSVHQQAVPHLTIAHKQAEHVAPFAFSWFVAAVIFVDTRDRDANIKQIPLLHHC